MIKKYYAEVDLDGHVIQTIITNDNIPPQSPFSLYQVSGPLDWNPPTPTSVKKWVNGVDVWVETASLAELRSRKNSEINAARLAENRKTFTFAGKEIACDELSRSDIEGVNGVVAVTQALPTGWINCWKAVDNTYVPITTVAQWISFYGAMVAKGSANFSRAQQLKAELDAATTSEAIAKITWT